jgi:hypothetical protein
MSGNTGVQLDAPADDHTFAACPFSGANAFDEAVRNEAVSWAIAPDQSVNYIRHDHAQQAAPAGLLAKYGAIKPLEVFDTGAWGQ